MWLQSLLNKKKTFETFQHSYFYTRSLCGIRLPVPLVVLAVCLNKLTFQFQGKKNRSELKQIPVTELANS